MGFLKSKFPTPPISTASVTDATVQARADEVAALAAKARGRQSTILTGMLGLSSSGGGASKVLLGGGS